MKSSKTEKTMREIDINAVLKELNHKDPKGEYFVLPKGNLHTGKPPGEVPHTRKTDFTPPKFVIPKKPL